MIGIKGVAKDWVIDVALLKNAKIITHEYDHAGYDGWAYTLFEKGGKLYETFGSHCSCNGLEDQWSPERVTRRQLKSLLNQHRNYAFSSAKLTIERYLKRTAKK